ncbi:MAG: PspC domain-containing protein [Bacteroidota bacterium]
MKRTFNINIGNSIVHIEEDAYETLTVYLNEVKFHFARNVDNFEIVTDIENRIAEMFAEILSTQQKQAIDINDVRSVTSQMGSVKDFESDEAEEEHASTAHFGQVKKLYRDTDQAIVAGVCAGLGHYMDIEERWIRLIAILTVLLGGSGVLAYIVLWVMIPKAESRSEKMAMRGEEVNLKGFANSYLHPFVKNSRGFLAEAFDLLGRFIQGTGKVIFKAFAVIIIVCSSLALISLIICVVALLGLWDSEIHNFPFSVINEEYFSVAMLGALLTAGIPVLALILFSVRVAFSNRPINKTFSFVLLIFWLTGVGISIYYTAKITSQFKENAEYAQASELKPFSSYTLIIDRARFFTKQDSLQYHLDSGNYSGRKILTNDFDDYNMPRNVSLSIEKSEDGKVSLSQNYSSQGFNFEDALKNAQNILPYGFLQQDSLLTFSPILQLKKAANWRNQEISMVLKVPVGTKLNINREFSRYLSLYGYWDCEHEDISEFTQLVMTTDGIKCQHEAVHDNDE